MLTHPISVDITHSKQDPPFLAISIIDFERGLRFYALGLHFLLTRFLGDRGGSHLEMGEPKRSLPPSA